MTEITVRTVWAIDPVAFAAAAILAPVAFAVCFFWVFLIPVVGVVLGAPLYFCAALPIFALALARHDTAPSELAVLGVAINLASLPVIALVLPNMLTIYGILGTIHAPIWAYLFGRFYRAFRRDPFITPVIS